MLFRSLAEVLVLGAPDPVWGETGLAVCVPRPGARPEPQAVLDWLEGRIARYKLPRRMVLLLLVTPAKHPRRQPQALLRPPLPLLLGLRRKLLLRVLRGLTQRSR